ncbi:hypothetical protein JWJ90_21455 [Desulfobulbus rhabdoformis]|uniref:hypothetical protein n=1 Tax=Desulfobulbus rhabdoformis TaxID=34032 RepID=UPI001966B056|nr:hypothetical protein [Desulfobulbus rhabdoformis]MBM9616834.1 hypothetical protein [Desulfobulbus rhabdoformis]
MAVITNVLFFSEIALAWYVDLGVATVKSHHDNPVKSAVENSKEVIHKTGKELGRFYNDVKEETSKGIHKTGKEIGRAPGNIVKSGATVYMKIAGKDFAPPSPSKESKTEFFQAILKNGLYNDALFKAGESDSYIVSPGTTKDIYINNKEAVVTISIEARPENCSNLDISERCWIAIVDSKQVLPNGFVITYDKYNDIIVTSME